MAGFKSKKIPFGGPRGGGGGDDGDSVSELSTASSQYSNVSKTRANAIRLLRATTKITGRMRGSSHSTGSGSKATESTIAPLSSLGFDTSEHLSVGSAVTSHDGRSMAKALAETHSKQSLMKSAKSRFNIGIVYLKTGDYAKALENLEQSLNAHIQLSGHDAKSYTPETLLAVAAVHEKLGDCFTAKSEISDKRLALDHYEESRKLLQSIEPGDAPEHVMEMLERVNEKFKVPELSQEASSKRPVVPSSLNKYEMKGNDKAKALLGFGAVANAVRITVPSPTPSDKKKISMDTKKPCLIGKSIEKIHQGIHEFANDIKDGIMERSFDHGLLSDAEVQSFAKAMSYLDRNDHKTAFNYLKSMQMEKSMSNPDFRAKLETNLLMVASSALEAGKNTVATDAYEELYDLLKQSDSAGLDSSLVMRGCIKSHKVMALEMESIMDYESAIQQRIRVKELLDENKRFIPACKQLLKIAYLQGEKNSDYDQCSLTLTDVVQRLLERSPSVDSMPLELMDLLVQCYHMGATTYSKANKWNEAVQQYDELLPLLAKTKGLNCKEYNSVSIHKAALLVKTGGHDQALTIIIKYFGVAEKSAERIVDDSDHILAMDIYTSLLLYIGDVDKAKHVFEEKLAFLDRLPKTDDMKSDTMHKLGCLLAFKNEPQLALPLLNEALDSRKRLFDGRHKAVFESTWAVATTAQSLGDTDRSLKEYSVLVDKKNISRDLPVDIIRILNSAGKLFLGDGNTDKSVASFRQALHEAETRRNDEQKHVAELNLANALSAKGKSDEAMVLYEKIVRKKELKLSKIFFLALVNKSLLLLKLGQTEEAHKILRKIEATHSASADDVRGTVYLLLGNVAMLNGEIDKAIGYFEDSLDVADDDVNSLVQAKKCISLAHVSSGQYDKAISTLDDLLEDLSGQSAECKSTNLSKAEIWNFMSRVYKKQGNLPQAKNFAKLALQTFKSVMGETHPTTLRNVSNLQVLLLDEAEGLDKSEAKFIIDVAKYELEDTLDAFEAMNDPWTYRKEMVSLRINLAFVAVWQGKPKKARKYLRQIKEVELPSDDLLMQRITSLENSVVQLEEKRLARSSYID